MKVALVPAPESQPFLTVELTLPEAQLLKTLMGGLMTPRDLEVTCYVRNKEEQTNMRRVLAGPLYHQLVGVVP